MNNKIFKKIIMLNISQDLSWCCFALMMMFYFDVPWYIALMPVAFNFGVFLYGASLVHRYGRIIPRTSEAVLPNNNAGQEMDEMLATIARDNLGDSLYGNVPSISPHLVHNKDD
jgi:hypothetical protein